MKRLKTYQKAIATITICLVSLYFFIYRGNNRLTVWVHHGLWLPPSTSNMNFYTYPGLLTHLVNMDDWAKTEFELPKTELHNLLKEQNYQYVTSIDSAENKLSWTYNRSGYRTIPDTIINGPLPLNLELKSSRGDFLIFHTEEKTIDTLYVHLYTDWN